MIRLEDGEDGRLDPALEVVDDEKCDCEGGQGLHGSIVDVSGDCPGLDRQNQGRHPPVEPAVGKEEVSVPGTGLRVAA